MKNCELCSGVARMHCGSDQANLCWSCDSKVHSANFLVARHSRTLLCHVCQSPTPWTADGSKLGPTVSVCDRCFQNYQKIDAVDDESPTANEDDEIETDNNDNDEYETEDEDDDEEDEEEDVNNEDFQVVPWSPTPPPPPPSSTSSSSNGEDESYFSSSSYSSSSPRRRGAQRKRTRENASDLRINADYVSTFSEENAIERPPTAAVAADSDIDGREERVGFVDSLSTSLKRRRTEPGRIGISGSRSWTIVESVKRLHEIQRGNC